MSTRLLKTKPFPKKYSVTLSNTEHDRLVEELEPIIVAGKVPWSTYNRNENGKIRVVLPWEKKLIAQIGVVVADIIKRNVPRLSRKLEEIGSEDIPMLEIKNLPTRGNPKSLEHSERIKNDNIGSYSHLLSMGLAILLNRTPTLPIKVQDSNSSIPIKNGRMGSLYWHCDNMTEQAEPERGFSTSIFVGERGVARAETTFLLIDDLAKHPDIEEHIEVLKGNNFSFGGEKYAPVIVEEDGCLKVSKQSIDSNFSGEDILDNIESGYLVPRNEEAMEAVQTLADILIALDSRLFIDTTKMPEEKRKQVLSNSASDSKIEPYSTILGPGTAVILVQNRLLHARSEYPAKRLRKAINRSLIHMGTSDRKPKQFSNRRIETLREELPEIIREIRIKRGLQETPDIFELEPEDVYDNPCSRIQSVSYQRRMDRGQGLEFYSQR